MQGYEGREGHYGLETQPLVTRGWASGRVQRNTFAKWPTKGKDVDGLYTDPLFVDATRRDFRFYDIPMDAKIGIKPFDFRVRDCVAAKSR